MKRSSEGEKKIPKRITMHAANFQSRFTALLHETRNVERRRSRSARKVAKSCRWNRSTKAAKRSTTLRSQPNENKRLAIRNFFVLSRETIAISR